MDYYRGLKSLRLLATSTAFFDEFSTLEAQLLENIDTEALLGPSEQSRRDRSRIVMGLNRLVSKIKPGLSFNDLCLSRETNTTKELSTAKTSQSTAVPSNVNIESFKDGNKFGVITGVRNYIDAMAYWTLPVAISDAKTVHEVLLRSGYDPDNLKLLTDDAVVPSRNSIMSAVNTIARNAKAGDSILFYYSGHGDVENGRDDAFLVTHDGKSEALADTAISLRRVKEIFAASPATSKFIIIDACSSGANLQAKGLRRMPPQFEEAVYHNSYGTAVLSSCKRDEFSYVYDENNHSVFSYFLIDAMSGKADRDSKGFVTVNDINIYVCAHVAEWCSKNNKIQHPTLSYEAHGDMIIATYT